MKDVHSYVAAIKFVINKIEKKQRPGNHHQQDGTNPQFKIKLESVELMKQEFYQDEIKCDIHYKASR
jgi:hypothetical protein